MSDRKKKQKKLINRLQRHYRLVVMNDDNFEIKSSIKLNPLNLLFVVSTLFVIYAFIIIGLLKIRPVQDLFFGPDKGPELRREALSLHQTIDSLLYLERQRSIYLLDIRQVLKGEVDTTRPAFDEGASTFDTLDLGANSRQDSILRAEFERKQQIGIINTGDREGSKVMEEKYFQPPVNGIVIKEFDSETDHFGIDIVAKENAPIKATLEGKVIFTGWTSEFGNIIALQHTDDLVSIYKHNAVLLKKVGNFVAAGEVIALLGNSGEFTQGPHLHFELWHEMLPINPLQYIVFN